MLASLELCRVRVSLIPPASPALLSPEQEENVVLRAQAKAAATAAALANLGGKAPGAPGPGPPGGPVTGANAIPAGTGAFAAVGFNYGGDEGGSGSESDEGDGGSDGEDSEDEGGGTAGGRPNSNSGGRGACCGTGLLLASQENAARVWGPSLLSSASRCAADPKGSVALLRRGHHCRPTRALPVLLPPPLPPPLLAEDVDMDRLAELFGVEDFSTMLRWAMRQEAAEAEANRNRPK